MSKIRIIGGFLGGRWIDTPERNSTHTMGDRQRTAIFNMTECENKTVLDAFAGSGSLGIEAISRGAKSATFIEKDRIAANIVVKNTTELNVKNECKIINTTVHNWAETNADLQGKFDLIFADPPYHNLQLGSVSELVNFLQINGLMVLSIPEKVCIPEIEGLNVVEARNYGNAQIVFFRKIA